MPPNTSSNNASAPPSFSLPPPSIENETLRKRLLTGGAGTNRGSLTKVAVRYRDFVEAVWTCARVSRGLSKSADSLSKGRQEDVNQQDKPPDHTISQMSGQESRARAATLGSALTRELLLYDIEIRKLALSSQASDGNSARYSSTLAQMQETLTETQKDIETLTVALARERRVKRNREEYNALAKIANERLPPMKTTTKDLQKVESETEAVKEELQAARRELAVRERQMRVLMQSIEDLKTTLEEEDMRATILAQDPTLMNSESASIRPSTGKKRRRLEEKLETSDHIGAL